MRVCERCRSLYPPGAKFCSIDGQPLVDSNGDPLIGVDLGRYRIAELLGRGGCGSVYRATHNELGTDFALKVLYGHLAAEGNYVERFRREAQAVSRIRSPWVASVIDFGSSENGLTYLVMEFCTGTTLDRLIARDKVFAPGRAARLIAQIASGLSVAHKLGFVHRDIKPANIAVDTVNGAEFAKVLDFGIVQLADPGDSGKLTREGIIMGTPAYMSPEQATAKEATPKSDLYSLGVVLYHLLAGQKPFKGGVAELMDQQVNKAPDPLPLTGPIADLTYALLAKDPDKRPASAQVVAEIAKRIEIDLRGGEPSLDPADLDHTIEPAPLTPPPVPKPGPAPEPYPTRISAAFPAIAPSLEPLSMGTSLPAAPRSRALPIAAALLIALGGTGAAYWFLAKESPKVEVKVDYAARVADLELELERVLDMRGLSDDALAALPATKAAYARYSALKSGDPAMVDPALRELVELARKAPIVAEVLTAHLDGLDSKLAEAGARLSPEEFERLKANYLELYRLANHASSDSELEGVAQSIRRFEREFWKAKPRN